MFLYTLLKVVVREKIKFCPSFSNTLSSHSENKGRAGFKFASHIFNTLSGLKTTIIDRIDYQWIEWNRNSLSRHKKHRILGQFTRGWIRFSLVIKSINPSVLWISTDDVYCRMKLVKNRKLKYSSNHNELKYSFKKLYH